MCLSKPVRVVVIYIYILRVNCRILNYEQMRKKSDERNARVEFHRSNYNRVRRDLKIMQWLYTRVLRFYCQKKRATKVFGQYI